MSQERELIEEARGLVEEINTWMLRRPWERDTAELERLAERLCDALEAATQREARLREQARKWTELMDSYGLPKTAEVSRVRDHFNNNAAMRLHLESLSHPEY